MTHIAELKIVVDSSQLEQATRLIDDLSKVAPKTRKPVDDLGKALDTAGDSAQQFASKAQKLIDSAKEQVATFGQGKAGVLEYRAAILGVSDAVDPLVNSLRTLKTEQKESVAAQKEQAAAATAAAKSQQQLSTSQERMLGALREEIALFGKSKDEILLYKANLLGIGDQVTPLVAELQRLKEAKDQEAKAGVTERTSAASAREAEKQALREKAQELEKIIALENESRRLASAGHVGDRNRGDAEAALGATKLKLETLEAAEASRVAARATDEQKAALATLLAQIDPVTASLNRLDAQQEALNKARKAGTLGAEDFQHYSAVVDKAKDKALGLNTAVVDQAAALNKLKAAIDPTTAALQKLDKEQEQLNLFKSDISPAEFEKLNGLLGERRKRIADLGATTGKTAKEINFSLRGLPAQFTDIFVSLQGGQNPMTVFLQQGGQLKDMFGGIGPAAKAMGGYILGLINPLTVTVALVGTLAVALYKGSSEFTNFNKSLIVTGKNTVGARAALAKLQSTVSSTLGVTKAAAASAAAEIAGIGEVSSKSLELVTTGAVALSKVTGKTVSEAGKEFLSLADKPSEAVLTLNKSYNFLTASVYEQIVALENQGEVLAATQLAQEKLAEEMIQRSKEVTENLGYLERAWKFVKDGAIGAWDEMVGLGRKSDATDRIMELRTSLGLLSDAEKEAARAAEAGQKNLLNYDPRVQFTRELFKARDTLVNHFYKDEQRAELARLELGQKQEKQAAATAEAEKDAEKAQLAATATIVSGAREAESQIEKLEKKLKSLRQARATPGVSDAIKAEADTAIKYVEKQIADARKKAEPRTPTPSVVREDAATKLLATMKEQEAALKAQASSTVKLGAEATKLEKLKQEFLTIENKQKSEILTKDQESLLANKEAILAQQETNAELERTIEKKNQQAKLDSISLGYARKEAAELKRIEDLRKTVGMGPRERSRVQGMTGVENERTGAIERAGEEFRVTGDQDTYDQAIKLAEAHFNERKRLLQDYYDTEDDLRGEWQEGMQEGFATFLETNSDMYGTMSELTLQTLTTLNEGLAESFTQALLYGEDLDTSLRNIATTLMEGILKGLIDMGLQFAINAAKEAAAIGVVSIAKKAAITSTAATSAAATATTTSTQVAAAATTATAWTPAAIVSSIGSFGVAAAIGLAAVIAALAFTGGFKNGGYTGNGGVDEAAGVVHGQEYVFDAGATARIGVRNLDALRAGRPIDTGDSGGGVIRTSRGGGGSVYQTINVTGVVDKRTSAQIARDTSRKQASSNSRLG